MSQRQLLYFLVLGSLFGVLVLTLELKAIAQLRSDLETFSVSKTFFSAFPWYVGGHLLLSVVVCGIVLAFARLSNGKYGKVINEDGLIVGIFFLLSIDLILIYCLAFGARFFSDASAIGLFLKILSLSFVMMFITLVPCALTTLLLSNRPGLRHSMQLLLIATLSFTAVTWLHNREIAITEKSSLISQLVNFESLVWLAQGLVLGGLALLLFMVAERFFKYRRLVDLRQDTVSFKSSLLFFIALNLLLWGWMYAPRASEIRASQPRVSGTSSDFPNVIEIVVDTLGAKYLEPEELFNYPGFNQLAKDGFYFEQAYTTGSNTAWSVPAILTSNFTFVNSKLHSEEYGWLDDNELTTAEILKSLGYETVGFSSNPIISKNFNYDQGFDHFVEGNSNRLFGFYLLKALGTLAPKFAYQNGVVDAGLYYQDIQEVYSNLENYLLKNRSSSRPFYMYVQTMDMHGPYMPPKEYLSEDFRFEDYLSYWYLVKFKDTKRIEEIPDKLRNNVLQGYMGGLRYTDTYISQLVQLLKGLGLYDRTLIIVTSDHGEEFWEHGSVIHGQSMYDELIRVPLFIKPPAVSKRHEGLGKGVRIQEPVTTLDILPTLADFIVGDLDISESHFKGRTLAPLMSGKRLNGEEKRDLYGVMLKFNYVIHDDWKLIRRKYKNTYELYNLRDDPSERENLFSDEHPVAQQLMPQLRQFARQLKEGEAKDQEMTRDLDSKLKEELKSLGYIQ